MTRPNIRINGRNFEDMDIAEEGTCSRLPRIRVLTT